MENLAKSVVTAVSKLPNREELNFQQRIPSNERDLKETGNQLIACINQVRSLMGMSPSEQLAYKDVEEAIDRLLEIAAIKSEIANQVKVEQVVAQNVIAPIHSHPKQLYNFADCIQLHGAPFVPPLKSKPFAKTPLDPRILEAQQNTLNNEIEFPHPYEVEIQELQHRIEIPSHVEKYRKLDAPKLIDTVDDLGGMILKIQCELDQKGSTEIALDLEHHHQKSYLGLTCLIQLSTRSEDYIIDPFPLWSHLGEMLNIILANPKITKVLHGAESDVLWLQRDFGLYILNLFDTFHAAKELQLPQCGYQHLLAKYCKQYTDKTFQLADWTQRPLSSEMLKYAQTDTHYLLYIYDQMLVELAETAVLNHQNKFQLVDSVFEKSKQTSLKVYRKPLQDQEQSLQQILDKQQKRIDKNSFELLVKLLELREQIGIEHDENPRYFLPNATLFNLCEARPKTTKELSSILRGERNMHECVKNNLWKFLKIFLQFDEEVKPLIVPQSKIEEEISIEPPQQSQSHQIQAALEQMNLDQIPVVIKPYERKLKTVRLYSSGGEEDQVQQIEKLFECQTAFKLLDLFYPNVGFEIFTMMQQQSQQQETNRQNSAAQAALQPQVVQTGEFMELPKLEEGHRTQKAPVDIRLSNTLENSYGVRLKRKVAQQEELRQKRQQSKNRFQC